MKTFVRINIALGISAWPPRQIARLAENFSSAALILLSEFPVEKYIFTTAKSYENDSTPPKPPPTFAAGDPCNNNSNVHPMLYQPQWSESEPFRYGIFLAGLYRVLAIVPALALAFRSRPKG